MIVSQRKLTFGFSCSCGNHWLITFVWLFLGFRIGRWSMSSKFFTLTWRFFQWAAILASLLLVDRRISSPTKSGSGLALTPVTWATFSLVRCKKLFSFPLTNLSGGQIKKTHLFPMMLLALLVRGLISKLALLGPFFQQFLFWALSGLVRRFLILFSQEMKLW